MLRVMVRVGTWVMVRLCLRVKVRVCVRAMPMVRVDFIFRVGVG